MPSRLNTFSTGENSEIRLSSLSTRSISLARVEESFTASFLTPCTSEAKNVTATQKSATKPALNATGVETRSPNPPATTTATGYPTTSAAVAAATFGRVSVQAIPSATRR